MEKIAGRPERPPRIKRRPWDEMSAAIERRRKSGRAKIALPSDSTNVVEWLITKSPIERKI